MQTTKWSEWRLIAVLAMLMALAACAPETLKVPTSRLVSVPEVAASDDETAGDQAAGDSEGAAGGEDEGSADDRLRMLRTEPARIDVPKVPDPSADFSSTNRVTVTAEAMPARNFVNYIFGDLLKLNYVIVEGAPGLDQPLNLNSPNPISSRELFKLASELLSGVGLAVVERDEVYFIGPADERTGFGLPIGYGRRLADVPSVAGSILQIAPSRFGLNTSLIQTLRAVAGAEVIFDNRQSAYFITGSRLAIARVLELLDLLDTPAARGSQVGLLELTFVSPAQFVIEVTSLFANEGISIGQDQALNLFPIDRLGAVVVFSASEVLLERLEFWARQIDREAKTAAEGYFVYQPKFARASDLGASVAALIGASVPAQSTVTETAQPARPRDTRSAMTNGGSQGSTGGVGGIMSVAGDGVRMTVDPISNTLIFSTSGPRYAALVPLIRRLDRAPRQVLLEATVAEVTLSGEFSRGVEFAFTEGRFEGGTLGRLGLPSGGFAVNFTEGLSRDIRARLQESDTQINVLSNPLLMVRDGFSASIQVGNDVPTVGAVASDPIESDRIVSSVQYRQTGLQLEITPTVNADGAVALAISQAITTTVPGSSGVQGAPVFFTRSVTTEVVASSGQSILIGGLMSESSSRSAESIPGLGRVPLIGEFFSSKSRRREKTELVLLITPRVIDSPREWVDIFRGFSKGLEYLQFDLDETKQRTLPDQANDSLGIDP